MEDVIQTYLLPYDPEHPVICFDEACRQLFGHVKPSQPARPGRRARVDYEYELYEAFPPEEARRILDRIDFHYTPKHGSWLNMAETEINIMNRQCLDRRLDSQAMITAEVAAWEKERNARHARIHWTFTLAAARRKLRKIYPSIEG
jgi:hypothetical protein